LDKAHSTEAAICYFPYFFIKSLPPSQHTASPVMENWNCLYFKWMRKALEVLNMSHRHVGPHYFTKRSPPSSKLTAKAAYMTFAISVPTGGSR